MINWARIAELRDEIGEDDLAEVVGMFLEETDDVIARLAAALPDNALEASLHFLKGSALNLGFADLAGLCQAGERLAAAGDAAQVDTAEIIALYHASKTAFLQDAALKTAA